MHKGNPHKHENSKDSVVKMDIYVILDKGEKLVGSDGIAKEVGNLQVLRKIRASWWAESWAESCFRGTWCPNSQTPAWGPPTHHTQFKLGYHRHPKISFLKKAEGSF